MKVLGIDVGGTNIKAGRVDESGVVHDATTVETPAEGGPDAILETIVTTVNLFATTGDIDAIGIGFPGVVDADGVVHHPPNLKSWTSVHVKALLEERLHKHIVVENDANAAAIAEADGGAGRDVSDFLYATLGTGVGGCVIINRKIYRGPTGGAGEIGHIIVDINSKSSSTGYTWRAGTVEEFAGRDGRISYYRNLTEETASISELVRRLTAGDRHAAATFEMLASYLAAGFASALAVLGMSTLIVGGGIVEAYPPLLPLIRTRLLERALPSIADHLDVRKATFGNQAGIIGAAFLARRAISENENRTP